MPHRMHHQSHWDVQPPKVATCPVTAGCAQWAAPHACQPCCPARSGIDQLVPAQADLGAGCRTVFTALYLVLEHGHQAPHTAARWDPPGSVFRLRLVCQVLEVCGQYFCRGLGARRLDRFLAFLHRYALAKPSLPLDIDLDIQVRLQCQAQCWCLKSLAASGPEVLRRRMTPSLPACNVMPSKPWPLTLHTRLARPVSTLALTSQGALAVCSAPASTACMTQRPYPSAEVSPHRAPVIKVVVPTAPSGLFAAHTASWPSHAHTWPTPGDCAGDDGPAEAAAAAAGHPGRGGPGGAGPAGGGGAGPGCRARPPGRGGLRRGARGRQYRSAAGLHSTTALTATLPGSGREQGSLLSPGS